MLTVPEAARLTGKSPETMRRWIRQGRLRAHKIGTQYVIEANDLGLAKVPDEALELPPGWGRSTTGEPMPNVVSAVRRSRAGH
jgi:excisionase family DNA binding protein